VGRSFGKMDNRSEVPKGATLRPTLNPDRIQFSSRQIQAEPGKYDRPLPLDKHTRAAERRANVIAAAISRACGER
jgi:hypothetical protein